MIHELAPTPSSSATYAAGARFPKLECGRLSLYSNRHCSMSLLASVRLSNQCMFRNSSRSLPLKLSMNPLSIGRPGAMKSISIPRLYAHWSKWLLVNSVVEAPALRRSGCNQQDRSTCQGSSLSPSLRLYVVANSILTACLSFIVRWHRCLLARQIRKLGDHPSLTSCFEYFS